ncbi:hypothetical protein NQ272_28040, partial [Escherichia coli]|nr:hypothetical protein [Escherichia coli]
GLGARKHLAEAHYSFRPSLTPKQRRQVNKTAKGKMEQKNGSGTAINGTAVKWNSSKMEQQSKELNLAS